MRFHLQGAAINRHRVDLILLLALAILLASCRGGSAPGTPPPTPTATPLATGLPPVPSPIPVGAAENPVTMVMVPVRGGAGVAEAAQTLSLLLSWWPDAPPTPEPTATADPNGPTPDPNAPPPPTPAPAFHVDVMLVDTHAEVIDVVCGHDRPAIGWLDGWTYLVAEASGCATPRYIAVGQGGRTGLRGMIVRHVPWRPVAEGETPPAPIDTVTDLAGRRFCRLGYEDVASWLLPALTMRARGVDPVTGLASVTDYANVEDLIRAVYTGECEAAGMAPDALDGLDLESLGLDRLQPTMDPLDPGNAEAIKAAEVILPPLDAAVVPLETTVEVPSAVMVYPRIVQLDVRDRLEQSLSALVGRGDAASASEASPSDTEATPDPREQLIDGIARALDVLLGAKSLKIAERDDFSALRNLMAQAGLDPVALGE